MQSKMNSGPKSYELTSPDLEDNNHASINQDNIKYLKMNEDDPYKSNEYNNDDDSSDRDSSSSLLGSIYVSQF